MDIEPQRFAQGPTRQQLRLLAVSRLDEPGPTDVEAIANALDRLRRVCARIGPATLRAEVYGVPTELICAALDDMSMSCEFILARYLDAGRRR